MGRDGSEEQPDSDVATGEHGERPTENKAQISKILFPAKINVLVDI